MRCSLGGKEISSSYDRQSTYRGSAIGGIPVVRRHLKNALDPFLPLVIFGKPNLENQIEETKKTK
jgi:hypothetical protein